MSELRQLEHASNGCLPICTVSVSRVHLRFGQYTSSASGAARTVQHCWSWWIREVAAMTCDRRVLQPTNQSRGHNSVLQQVQEHQA